MAERDKFKLEQMGYEINRHIPTWTIGNEKVWIKGEAIGGEKEHYGSIGNIFASKAVEGDDLIKKMGILLGNMTLRLRDKSNGEAVSFNVGQNDIEKVSMTVYPDHVEESIWYKGLLIESLFFVPRGFHGFLARYKFSGKIKNWEFVPEIYPNPYPYATASFTKWEGYHWETGDDKQEIIDNFAHIYTDGCSVVVGSRPEYSKIEFLGNRTTFVFDLVNEDVFYLGFGYSFGDKEKAFKTVKDLLCEPDEHFRANQDYWERFFASCPRFFSGERSKRLLWYFWHPMMNINQNEYVVLNPVLSHNRAGCYNRTFSWDALFGMVSLSLTEEKQLAWETFKEYLRYNMTEEGRCFMGVSLDGRTDNEFSLDFSWIGGKQKTICDSDLQPLLPWAVLEFVRNLGRPDILDEEVNGITIYERLKLYVNHIERDQEDPRDGLLIRDHFLESGWDNRKSFLNDKGIKDKVINIQVFYYWSLMAMADICEIKGERELADKYLSKAKKVGRSVRTKMWCEEHRCYEDIDINGNKAHVLCLDTFLPLFFENNKDRKKVLITHLKDEKEFNLPKGLPTLAANEPDFNCKGWGWRGNCWFPMVALVAMALGNCGEKEEGLRLLTKVLDNYNPSYELGEHQNPYTGEMNGLSTGPHNWLGLVNLAAKRLTT